MCVVVVLAIACLPPITVAEGMQQSPCATPLRPCGGVSVFQASFIAVALSVIFVMKPTKRSSLQSPNPVKHVAQELEPSAQTPVLPELESYLSPPPEHADALGSDNGTVRPTGPPSPHSNRERFLAGFTPMRTCCNLDLCRAPAGTKLNLSAICIAVFPATTNPDRRYVQLADNTGVVGVTVWNANVHKFGNDSVGSVVVLQKAVISSHQGKKQLTLARDAVVKVGGDEKHEVSSWWTSLLLQTPKSCGAVHDKSENSIVSVAGILGRVSSETKIVHSQERLLTCLHLVDATGKLDVRSWNHAPDSFLDYVDRPILIQRVKVASFAGTKLCELLDYTGSIIVTEFPGKNELIKFWSE
jgi:hypothetical protein